ncbi:MAG: hypothetical protein KAH18_12555 [Psychromonas sp.]|nr:hypothetical protein [Psychromonas sp.]
MTILYPIFYLLLGYMTGKTKFKSTKLASFILTKFMIPIVIIWNISIYFDQMSWIIISATLIMLIIFFITYSITSNATDSLCLCYLNVGWFGLPIAMTLFGDQSARFMLAVYIGSSIFGNSIGTNYLSGTAISAKKIISSPPIIALIIGLCLIPFNKEIAKYGQDTYEISKSLMSFFGMLVLGIWIARTQVQKNIL